MAAQMFATPTLSTRSGVLPPRQAVVGKAVVPTEMTTVSMSARMRCRTGMTAGLVMDGMAMCVVVAEGGGRLEGVRQRRVSVGGGVQERRDLERSVATPEVAPMMAILQARGVWWRRVVWWR